MLVPVTPHRPVSAALERRNRTAGGAPLLTHYGAGGARTELSVASFANWVAKTTNLVEDLGVADGDVVALPVLDAAPGHWMSLVWPFALWRAGLPVTPDAADPDLAVIGPADPRPAGATTLACSLDPWARPLADLPPGVLDYASEALAQPDAAADTPASPDAVAWADATRTLSGADLSALDPIADRVLLRPADAWSSVTTLVRAVLGGGSLVVVDDPDADPARVAAAERARVVA